LHDACIDGAGDVVHWAQEPDEDEKNPALEDNPEHPWPAKVHNDNFVRRSQVANIIRENLGLSLEDVRSEYADDIGGESTIAHELIRGWDDDIAMLLEERSRERSQSRALQLPASLSASDLVRLAADQDGFTQHLARPMPTPPAGAARRGTRFHAWVESHYGIRPLLDPEDLPGAADSEIDSDEELQAMQAAFLASDYADRTPVDVEVDFNLVLAGRVIPGRIDAVFAAHDESGEVRFDVIDWKTSRQRTSDPLQLAIYRIAYAELMDVPVERVSAAFVYVRDGAVVRFDDLPDRHELEKVLSG
jgi:DNA helicase-2/ATP-dependent DNA helicase PcrA